MSFALQVLLLLSRGIRIDINHGNQYGSRIFWMVFEISAVNGLSCNDLVVSASSADKELPKKTSFFNLLAWANNGCGCTHYDGVPGKGSA